MKAKYYLIKHHPVTNDILKNYGIMSLVAEIMEQYLNHEIDEHIEIMKMEAAEYYSELKHGNK